MIECAFINSVITTDSDHDNPSKGRSSNSVQTCAQQDTMAKRISELRMMWRGPSVARDKSEYVPAL